MPARPRQTGFRERFREDLRLLTVGFTAGVVAAHALPQLPAPEVLAPLGASALVPWRGRALWAAAVLGFVFVAWRAAPLLAERWPESRFGEDVWIRGVVASLPERGGQGEQRHVHFRFAPVQDDLPQRIRVGWYRPSGDLRAGDCRELLLRLRPPHGSLNPGAFDYEGWLFRAGIGATATVRDSRPCVGDVPRWPLLELRQSLVDRIAAALPGDAAVPMLQALTVGDDSGFSDADWHVFRATGTGHLVAVSGFNVAIVAGLAFFLCRWLWSLFPCLCLQLPAQRAALPGSAVLAGGYALLAGFEAPVQRAVIMLWAILAAAWAHRLAQPSRVLAIAWLAVLACDPFAVVSPGLWLSFGAVAAIFHVSLGRLRPPGFWHTAAGLQLLLAVALAPLSLHFFQGASLAAPLANLVAVPLFTLLTPWAIGALLMHVASPAAGTFALSGAAWTLNLFQSALGWLAQFPQWWWPAAFPAAALACALIGAALLFAPRGLPLRALGTLCFVPLLFAPVTPPRGSFELTVLDVGQGLAAVVRTARHTLLYDAGPAFEDGFDAGESVVAPFVLSRGLRDVDLLLVSHGDNDHAGGVPAVRRLLRVRREIGTASACRGGEHWEWDGVRFAMLHPDAGSWRGNDSSCVLRVDGAFSALLAGDIEARAESHLLRDHASGLRSDVLVAPHHGSRTSSTAEFVAAVRPKLVIYGAGWHNHFNHPRPEVVARYAAIGARQVVTGNSGAVSVWLEQGELRVEEWRRVAARFWNARSSADEAMAREERK